MNKKNDNDKDREGAGSEVRMRSHHLDSGLTGNAEHKKGNKKKRKRKYRDRNGLRT